MTFEGAHHAPSFFAFGLRRRAVAECAGWAPRQRKPAGHCFRNAADCAI